MKMEKNQTTWVVSEVTHESVTSGYGDVQRRNEQESENVTHVISRKVCVRANRTEVWEVCMNEAKRNEG